MEERKLTERESVELIATMIAKTKRHLTHGEGNMLLFWGYLCTIVALLHELYSYLSYGMGMELPFSGKLIWWLIPAVGIPYTLTIQRRNAGAQNVVTYTDKLSNSLWNYVMLLAVITIIIGALFFISGLNVWYVMMLFAFFVIGMAVSVQGMIIKEKPMIYGGAFSVLSGGFICAGMIIGASWLGMYTVPLFIISFIVMMIIPGHILNHKAEKA